MKQVILVLIVIGFAGMAVFIGRQYLMVNTKDSVVNH